MELSMMEQQLLSVFRELTSQGQHELLSMLAALKNRELQEISVQLPEEKTCRLTTQQEKQKKTISDPIFTE